MAISAERRRFQLGPDYSIPRIIVGGWQFSRGHGGARGGREKALALLGRLVDQGLDTFDCADIYTGVEELLGQLVRMRGTPEASAPIQVHTKFVPDLEVLPTIDRAYVETIIHRSLTRLGVERLDLVQFHWWDFSVPGHVQVMERLGELQEAGKIRHLGVTNYDEEHLEELLASGVEIVSNQVQYSALDRRPEARLAPYCRERNVALLCYGGLSGGFLTEAFLAMDTPPAEAANRSLVKYRLIIDECGGWGPYQALLRVLGEVATRHGVSIPAVALRLVLDRPGVAATITGLDSVDQAGATLKALELELDQEDQARMDRAMAELAIPPGPVYGLERDREGAHGAIMRYNLNRG